MNASGGNCYDALSPSSDDAIARALAQLQNKFEAWASTASLLHQHLADAVSQLRVAKTLTTSELIAQSGPSTSPTALADTAGRMDQVAERTETAQLPDVQENNERSTLESFETLADEQERIDTDAASLSPHRLTEQRVAVDEQTVGTVEGVHPISGAETENEPAAGAAPTYDQGTKEDIEGFLRSLEPETAKIIRARYRLFAGAKSVQEVLEEYETEMKAKSGKRWWKRANK